LFFNHGFGSGSSISFLLLLFSFSLSRLLQKFLSKNFIIIIGIIVLGFSIGFFFS